MKKLNENEMIAVNGGKRFYFWSANPNCSYYTSGDGTFAEVAAAARMKAHMIFCVFCTMSGRKLNGGYSLPKKCR